MKEENSKAKALYALGLAKRYNENFLSDIVRAYCLYSDDFLKLFFKYCFPNDECEVYSIDREVSEEGVGRNDFKIYTDKGIYIVESKILDTKVDNSAVYKEKFEKVTYIVSKQNSQFNQIEEKLSSQCIKCVCWEKFVDCCIDNDFAIIARSILNHEDTNNFNKPKLSDIEYEKNLCDNFFKEHLKSKYYDEKGGNVDEWDRIGGYAYGYTIWASVWFGLLWCPLKGVFWGFAYGEGGLKKNNPDKIYSFKYIKPLGEYFNDGYFYYEILPENDEMNDVQLNRALEEFAKLILVDENDKSYVPLLNFIKR